MIPKEKSKLGCAQGEFGNRPQRRNNGRHVVRAPRNVIPSQQPDGSTEHFMYSISAYLCKISCGVVQDDRCKRV